MNGDSKGDPFSANQNADSDQRSAPGKPVGGDVEPIQPFSAQQSEFLCDEVITNGRTVANETQSAPSLYDSVVPFMMQPVPNDAVSLGIILDGDSGFIDTSPLPPMDNHARISTNAIPQIPPSVPHYPFSVPRNPARASPKPPSFIRPITEVKAKPKPKPSLLVKRPSTHAKSARLAKPTKPLPKPAVGTASTRLIPWMRKASVKCSALCFPRLSSSNLQERLEEMSDVFYIPTVEPPRRETGRQSYHRAAAEKV
ncbi:hypothetical protein WA577_003002, partial [Blastocystis sp. JDR]